MCECSFCQQGLCAFCVADVEEVHYEGPYSDPDCEED